MGPLPAQQLSHARVRGLTAGMHRTRMHGNRPAVRRRAVNGEQKARRRRAILDAALELFDARGFERVSVAEVAARTRLAKGTLYLYFPTREALFLALLTEQFEAFFDALDAALERPVSRDAFVDHLVRDLHARPRLLRLIAVMHTVLERNVDLDTALEFKRFLAARAQASGARIDTRVRGVPTGFGQRLLLWLHALAIGLHHMAEPAPVVRQAIRADPRLAAFDIDFPHELRAMLTRLLRAPARSTSRLDG
ncbi:MAG TPA: TetR family transcriptional regulator [Rhodanobacteraceae bacterium]|nr:TetR family transcriptional regulator [Rhodanobacteraceae bacterium]